MEIFRWYLGFLPESKFLLDGSGFLGFRGRETKTDPSELVSGREDLPLTARVVGWASVGSDPNSFFRWARGSDVFGQP